MAARPNRWQFDTMRISTGISYSLGQPNGSNYRCAQKSVPALKLFRDVRRVYEDPFPSGGEVRTIFVNDVLPM